MDHISIYEHLDSKTFEHLVSQDFPFIIRGQHFGECHTKWDWNYLADRLVDTPVKIHVSDEPNLNFIDKNFKYDTLLFAEFIRQCLDGEKYFYLRSIGNDKRGKDVANICKQFPSIKEDIKLPDFAEFCTDEACAQNGCDKRHLFSSVFRISSKGLVMWTHYDMVDNILLQVRGRKKIYLFPPTDAEYLYLNGDKSEILDLENVDFESYPLMSSAHRYECILEEGDALFIPALWFHNTKALDFSIGVNFFWQDNTLKTFYDKSDTYGNKDLVPAVNAYTNITKAIKQLDLLPAKYRTFYIHMIMAKLNKQLNK